MRTQKDTDKTISLISLVSGVIVPILAADYVYKYLLDVSKSLSGWETAVLIVIFLTVAIGIESYFIKWFIPQCVCYTRIRTIFEFKGRETTLHDSLEPIQRCIVTMDSQQGHRIAELFDSTLFTYLLEIGKVSAVKRLVDKQED
jgi:hypothetical protein